MVDYDFFVADVDAFCARLDALRALRGHAVVDGWQAAARAGRTADVVRDLLVAHYDPIYLESMRRNFAGVSAPSATLHWDGSEGSLREAAQAAVESLGIPP
jgi:tRNA 2-selenouridine synthase